MDSLRRESEELGKLHQVIYNVSYVERCLSVALDHTDNGLLLSEISDQQIKKIISEPGFDPGT